MKNKIIIIKFLAFVLCINVKAQSNIENVLAEIRKNNKTIQATAQFYEAQNLQYKTGNTPNNPTVEYDFLSGSPAAVGNQHDLTIAQQFDFPIAYIKKSQLAKTQTAQSEFEIQANRQSILLQAKQYCIALVYHKKLQSQLMQQKQSNEKLITDYQTKLDKGEGNILDVNKAKLQFIQVKNQLQQNTSEIAQLNTKLTSLNGGNPILFTDTVYQITDKLPSFEQLVIEYENADPLGKILEQEKLITQKQLELSKSMWLPKMEIGYHYQGILGQTYNGIHTGISIPIWENKNSIKHQKSKLLYSELKLQVNRNQQYHEIKSLYEKYTNLKVTLDEFRSNFETLNSTALLNKALYLGEISTIQYWMEINYYRDALNNFLQIEMDYQLTISELNKFQL
jgi:outer membrane protein, heavy metal efflux system